LTKKIRYLKVEGEPDLVRDTKSKAILNINVQALENYKKSRETRLKTNKMLVEFEQLKNDVSEIKNLLIELTKKS
jgi:hypothetical protein